MGGGGAVKPSTIKTVTFGCPAFGGSYLDHMARNVPYMHVVAEAWLYTYQRTQSHLDSLRTIQYIIDERYLQVNLKHGSGKSMFAEVWDISLEVRAKPRGTQQCQHELPSFGQNPTMVP